ncbi:MAG: TIM barrel protein [Candidatus Bathyarchaeia archaeon]
MPIAIVVSVEPDVKPLGLGGDFKSNLRQVSQLGYDGVELFLKDPDKLDLENTKRLVEEFNLSIPAVGTGPTYTIYGLSLSSQEKTTRERAIRRVAEYLRIGRVLNSPVIIGSIKGRTKDYQSGIKNLRNSLKRCAEFAEDIGTRILIEPLNRYESNLVTTVEEAIELKEETGSDHVGVMADTFHMNIEERSIYDSIIKAGNHLEHIHFADSNRHAPGQGHLDFKQIMRALKEINYRSFITGEILPLPNQYTAAKLTIEYLKKNLLAE